MCLWIIKTQSVVFKGGSNVIDISDEFIIKIRKVRGEKILTKEITSREIGINRKTYSSIERGDKKKIRITTYKKIVNWIIRKG